MELATSPAFSKSSVSSPFLDPLSALESAVTEKTRGESVMVNHRPPPSPCYFSTPGNKSPHSVVYQSQPSRIRRGGNHMNDRKKPNPDELLVDHNHDGIDRRGFLKCMAWAG